MDLRRLVDAAWIDRRFLADGERHEVATAYGTSRIECPGLEALPFPRRRSHVAVLRAPVPALAVDDHAARQHESPNGARAVHRGEYRCGSGVVVRDVLGDVRWIDAETDHRGVVGDRVDAPEGMLDHVNVAHVAAELLDAGSPLLRGDVQHDRLDASLEQRVDDVRADEPCAARHEDAPDAHHGRVITISRARAAVTLTANHARRVFDGSIAVAVNTHGTKGSQIRSTSAFDMPDAFARATATRAPPASVHTCAALDHLASAAIAAGPRTIANAARFATTK